MMRSDLRGTRCVRRSNTRRWASALIAGAFALLSANTAMAACRLSDYSTRDLASLSEIERLGFVTQMTRTEFTEFKHFQPGNPNYYSLIAASPNLMQAKQRAQSVIDALGMPHSTEYAKIWATNHLDDKGLTDYNTCQGGSTIGLFLAAREVRPGAINMVFAHTRPVGVGPLPVTLVASQNIRNSAQLVASLAATGPRNEFFAIANTLTLADRTKPASVTMKFGEENPTTLYIPAFPLPKVTLPASVTAIPAVGTAFRDCADVCPEMVLLPAGSFTMGIPAADNVREGMPTFQINRTTPLHTVNIGANVAIGKYEVTIGEFRAFVNETGYKAQDSCVNMRKVAGIWVYDLNKGYNWQRPGFDVTDRQPVTCVSSDDAHAYADWLSRKTGYHYSLPSESVFEYAARAGTTTAYFWGDDPKRTEACLYSNQPDKNFNEQFHNSNARGIGYAFACDDGYTMTAPVGSFRPNAWGLYDMLGNAWEVTEDCWNNNYEGAPADGSAWMTGDCDQKVGRGGSLGNATWLARTGNRIPYLPDYVGHAIGFRIASKR